MSGKSTTRRSSLTSAVTYASITQRQNGSKHTRVTEQLTLSLSLPPPAAHPQLVVTKGESAPSDQERSAISGPSGLAELGRVLGHVLDFHEAFGLPREPLPTTHVGDSLAQLRVRLLQEEVDEFALATEQRDLVAIADALADVVYVAYGSAVTYGIDLEAVVDAVHRSNMSKLDSAGRPVLRKDGKVLKSERYRPPAIEQALDQQLPLFDAFHVQEADRATAADAG